MIRFLVSGLLLIVAPHSYAENCLEISELQFKKWKSLRPEPPGLFYLYTAKKLADNERTFALELGSDKRAHCYLGCRISEKTSFETAKFAAWHKEYSDAIDCNPRSYFEIADYDATIKGALYGADKSVPVKNKTICVEYCKAQYK